jgi:ribokinase
MPTPSIIVVGSSNTDMVIKLDRIPRPGETILGGEFVTAAGGKGANQAVGATGVVMQLETPLETVQASAELAADAGVRVIVNPAPARPLPDKLLKLVCVLTPNETEAELLTGVAVSNDATAAKAAGKLLARGVQNVVITMGARGAFVAGKDLRHLIPGFKVKAVDTTGSGDIFSGALVVALAEGRPLLEAARFASAAAAISVTRFGAQPSAPTRPEIEAVLAAGKVQPGARVRRQQ